MPELPEVETVVRGLRPLLVGERFAAVIARRPDLRWPLPVDLGQRLTGATVLAVRRRAKYGLIDTDRGDTLIFHLGMSGRFRACPDPPEKHDHVVFVLPRMTLAYTDPRRFGSMDLVPTAEAWLHPLLRDLGPEPLGEGFTAQGLAAQAQGRMTPVKALILDQKVVAGIGNIYACEALFEARINPARKAGFVATARLTRLHQAIRETLAAAIEAGGSTLRDHAQVSGELGYFQHGFKVYGREGAACPVCGSAIVRRVQAGRSTFQCVRCQR
jgi:formamidopyrimidine-DNA glycosylase